jgi:metal-responsive CopG/Arc/MetJ family transcriptional regulator
MTTSTISTMHQSTSTTDMEVTSIRLERELKEKLKAISGNQGYQALIRDVLWNFINTQDPNSQRRMLKTEIRASIAAIAQQEESCMLTGKLIRSQDLMLLGLTHKGTWVPLAIDSLTV